MKITIVTFVTFITIVVICLVVLAILFRRNRTETYRRIVSSQSRKNEKSRSLYGQRRIPQFERRGIVIPKWSNDTRACDDFENIVECLVSDGYNACFECIESRTYTRVCAHFSHDITLYDEKTNTNVTIPANSSSLNGYCVRENVAKDLRDLDAVEGRVSEMKRECSIFNAEWLLTRKYTGDASISSYNFVCRCKYPNLMNNENGPMTACSKDVGCNGHGQLDDESRASKRDPFVDGTCMCEKGWLSERNDQIGPYCREATFEEWPSLFFPTNNENESLELNSEYIDPTFQDRINGKRVDKDAKVWLPNPCTINGCTLEYYDNQRYICADYVTLSENGEILSVSIAVRTTRDYLKNNGGEYPNSCIHLTPDEINNYMVLRQYCSQEDTKAEPEIGILVRKNKLGDIIARLCYDKNIVKSSSRLFDSREYSDFRDSLQPALNSGLDDYGVLWTFNSKEFQKYRKKFADTFGLLLFPQHSDLGKYREDGMYWVAYSYYVTYAWVTYYEAYDNTTPSVAWEKNRYLPVLPCPDNRQLERYAYKSREISKELAMKYIQAAAAGCSEVYEDEGELKNHTRFNCKSDNQTACLLFSFPSGGQTKSDVSYGYIIAYPRNINMRVYCNDHYTTAKKNDS